MSSNEDLLTAEEIANILKGIENNPQLRNPNVVTIMKCGRDLATVHWVSPNKGLIWVKGNEDTGLEHISNRHGWFSTKQYWQYTPDEKLDNPSRFTKELSPFKHYNSIAEEIYTSKNLNIEKNRCPDLFEIYDGISSYESNQEQVKFRLILYKGTTIVHTLFQLNGEKKIFVNLVRGNCQSRIIRENNDLLYVFSVPYRNKKGEALYSFEIHYLVDQQIERGFVVNQITKKTIMTYERKILKTYSIEEIVDVIQRSSLSEIEKFIKRLMKQERS